MSDWITIEEAHSPTNSAEVAELLKNASAVETPVFPLGGETSLDFGLPCGEPGWSLSTNKLSQIVDYPARDMTITVESGVTMQTLADTLGQNGQRLPIDVPNAESATIGGVVACNFNGPRRFSLGTVRDYVIGIEAIDGRGTAFKGGGRVVKNVAGYDFCKLLTGSLGTLAVITQLTLKLKPQPQSSVWLAAPMESVAAADPLLEALTTTSPVPAAAVEMVGGPGWQEALGMESDSDHWLLVALEGTASEVKWMEDSLRNDWHASLQRIDGDPARNIWQQFTEFPNVGDPALVVSLSVIPSGLPNVLSALTSIDSEVRWLAHAGSGIVIAHFAELPDMGVSRAVTGTLRTAAARAHGHVSILRNRDKAEVSRNSVWGVPAAINLMQSVKRQFDPAGILNRGRFVY